ncbi:hypothetical protein HKW97_24400 (plasmid) [Pseudomonas luteola]|uniref:hypothetical protein n=1 Tax=Pseudomonas luteola TaxID=47886 RepID=UPI00388FE741
MMCSLDWLLVSIVYNDVLLKERKTVLSFVVVLILWSVSALIALCASDTVLDGHNALGHFVLFQQVLFPAER